MRRVRARRRKSQPCVTEGRPGEREPADGAVTIAMIRALIPLGLRAVEEALARDVRALADARYARDDGHPDVVRWGTNRARSFWRTRGSRSRCHAYGIGRHPLLPA